MANQDKDIQYPNLPIDSSSEDERMDAQLGLSDVKGNTVKRDLKQRHIAMIALGSTIGTGLFVGLGTSLSGAGPLSTLLGYCIMGVFIWGLMVSIGEMATYLPVAGGWVHHTSRFVDPSLGPAVAWVYWFSYGITLAVEISAGSLIIGFWDPERRINIAIWISILLVVNIFSNFLPVRFYGEIEFWLTLLKVVVIILLIITMLVIDLGGGPSGDFIGGRYWRDPGPMAQLFWELDPVTNTPTGGIPGTWGRFLAFWNVFVAAAFSFAGTEMLGIAVGEVENPRKNVPKAVNRVAYRIILFYICSVLMVGLVVPYNDPMLLNGNSDNASASPYVIAVQNAGIKVLPHFVNAILLVVTVSAGQSDLYGASRVIYGIALEGNAPKIFAKCTKSGIPIYSVAITALYAPLAYMSVGTLGAEKAFSYLYDLSAITILMVWWAIMIAYIRFYHGLAAQGIPRSVLPYKAPLQPYLSYVTFFFFTVIILLSAYSVFMSGHWETDTFIVNYISIPVFFLIWLGYKFWTKSKLVPLSKMDFVTGRKAVEELDEKYAIDEKEKAPKTTVGKFFNWLA